MKLGQRDTYVQGRKFWEVQVVRDVAGEACVQVAWGRRGTKGGVATWRSSTLMDAVDNAEARALAKRRKGYQLARTSQDAALYGDPEAENVRRELDLSGARPAPRVSTALSDLAASGLAPATQQRIARTAEVAAAGEVLMAGRCSGSNAGRWEDGVEIHLRVDRPKRPPPVGRLGGDRRVSFDDD